MKILKIFTFISIILVVFCENSHRKFLNQQNLNLHCEKLVTILSNVVNFNQINPGKITKIAVTSYKTTFDLNCILNRLSRNNKNILIHSISKNILGINSKIYPDYLIYFGDFNQDVSKVHSIFYFK